MAWRESAVFGNVEVEGTLTQAGAATVAGTLAATGDLTVGGVDTLDGIAHTVYAATATADGLTTGLIPLSTGFVAVTSAGANNIVTLPAGTAGQVINVYVGANGCEMRTPATSGATINGVDSDGTNELALGATTSYICTCVATDTWIVRGFTALAADQAALVPDAA